MSRSNGVYSLPQPAFVPGTKISSSAVNSNFSDIATALTQSISADGQTSITSQLKFVAGTAALPGMAFALDGTTGVYLPSAGTLGLAAGGTQIVNINSSGVQVTGAITATTTITATSTVAGSALNATGTSANQLPSGTTGQRPGSPVAGQVRWNSSTTQLEVYDGTNWTATSGQAEIAGILDGGGVALTSGTVIFIPVAYAFLINQMTMVADQTGSIVVDIWKVAFGSFPPTVSNTITASDIPTITSAQSVQDSTLTGWTTQVNAGDVLAFNVKGNATTITRVTMTLRGKKT